MSKIKILQIGPHSYVGGISIHIKRLTSILSNDFEFNYIDESSSKITPSNVLNVRRIKDQIKIWDTIKKQNLIHIHSGNWLFRLYFILFSSLLRKPFVVTLHSYRIKGFKALITELLLSRSKLIIAVSQEIIAKLPDRLKDKITLKEAFIPPNMDDEPTLPSNILELIEGIIKERKFLITANAFRLTTYNSGELYGLDQCIGIAELAKKNKLNLHIVFIIGTIREDGKKYYNSFRTLIESRELGEYITIVPEKLSFVRLIQYSDLVLRPTLSDGDAITIREALFLNKKILASDVVKRPEGTYLFRTGDIQDLYSKIVKITLDNSSPNTELNCLNNYKKEYSKIYNRCNN